MVIHVYHPYRQPDGVNHCAAVNGHCSHLCLPAPLIGRHSPRVSCACPNGLRLLPDNQMCVEDSEYHVYSISTIAGALRTLSTKLQVHRQAHSGIRRDKRYAIETEAPCKYLGDYR